MSKSKQKGTSFETLITNWFNKVGRTAVRNPPAGNKDIGDIKLFSRHGRPIAVECKNEKTMRLAAYVDEAQVEGDRLAEKYYSGAEEEGPGIVVHKRRGKGQAEDQYVTMDLGTFERWFL